MFDPDYAWSNYTWLGRLHRLIRTMKIVAVAGTVGAIGGGIGVASIMGADRTLPEPQISAGVIRPVQPREAALAVPQQSNTAPALSEASPPPADPALQVPTAEAAELAVKRLYDRAASSKRIVKSAGTGIASTRFPPPLVILPSQSHLLSKRDASAVRWED
jgi:hypothetical protein